MCVQTVILCKIYHKTIAIKASSSTNLSMLQDGAVDGCLCVWCMLFCLVFVCILSFLLLYPELAHQREAHEHQGKTTSGFISHFSRVICGTFIHNLFYDSQRCGCVELYWTIQRRS